MLSKHGQQAESTLAKSVGPEHVCVARKQDRSSRQLFTARSGRGFWGWGKNLNVMHLMYNKINTLSIVLSVRMWRPRRTGIGGVATLAAPIPPRTRHLNAVKQGRTHLPSLQLMFLSTTPLWGAPRSKCMFVTFAFSTFHALGFSMCWNMKCWLVGSAVERDWRVELLC